MNKHLLLQQILGALALELEGYERSARSAHAEATDEQSRAENKYDTRGLEAAYLARGQSRQASEVVAAIQCYQSLRVRSFATHDPIDSGAGVELDSHGQRTRYFLGPCAGGTEIVQGGQAILVITPQSPLGEQIAGKRQGDRVEIKMGRMTDSYEISAVW